MHTDPSCVKLASQKGIQNIVDGQVKRNEIF